jgi:tetratricopeptide (TPR) repeat protein
VPGGIIREDPISLVDLEPTLARIFDLPPATVPRTGRTLAWDRPEPEPVPLYAETFRPLISYDWSELRSVRWGDWKLIRGPTTDELYNLREDPCELRDLGDVEPAPRLRALLDDLAADDDAEAVLAAARGTPDPGRREALESLGYVGADPETAPAPGPRPHPKDALPRWLDLQLAKEYVRVAGLLVRADRLAESAALVDSALALDVMNVPAVFLRGHIKQRSGDFAGAKRDYRQALELDPAYVIARQALNELEAWERQAR